MEIYLITFAIGHVLEGGHIVCRTNSENTLGIRLNNKYAKIAAFSREGAIAQFEDIFGTGNWAFVYTATSEGELEEYGYSDILEALGKHHV